MALVPLKLPSTHPSGACWCQYTRLGTGGWSGRLVHRRRQLGAPIPATGVREVSARLSKKLLDKKPHILLVKEDSVEVVRTMLEVRARSGIEELQLCLHVRFLTNVSFASRVTGFCFVFCPPRSFPPMSFHSHASFSEGASAASGTKNKYPSRGDIIIN